MMLLKVKFLANVPEGPVAVKFVTKRWRASWFELARSAGVVELVHREVDKGGEVPVVDGVRVGVIRGQAEVLHSLDDRHGSAVIVRIGDAVVVIKKTSAQGLQTGAKGALKPWTQAREHAGSKRWRACSARGERAIGIDHTRHPFRQRIGGVRRLIAVGGTQGAGNIDVVAADQPVRAHEEVAEIECKASSELALDFSAGLFGVGYLAHVVIHPAVTNAAGTGSESKCRPS